MLDFLLRSVVIGIGGTAAMDLWALLLSAVFALALPNWGVVARWFADLARDSFSIRTLPPHRPFRTKPPLAGLPIMPWASSMPAP